MCRTAVAREGDRRVIIDENAPQDHGAAETFPQMIRSAAKAYGEETLFVLEDDGVLRESITFAVLARRSGEITRWPVGRGIGMGGGWGALIVWMGRVRTFKFGGVLVIIQKNNTLVKHG